MSLPGLGTPPPPEPRPEPTLHLTRKATTPSRTANTRAAHQTTPEIEPATNRAGPPQRLILAASANAAAAGAVDSRGRNPDPIDTQVPPDNEAAEDLVGGSEDAHTDIHQALAEAGYATDDGARDSADDDSEDAYEDEIFDDD